MFFHMLWNFSHICIKESLLGNKMIPYNEKMAKTEDENLEIFRNSKWPWLVFEKTIYYNFQFLKKLNKNFLVKVSQILFLWQLRSKKAGRFEKLLGFLRSQFNVTTWLTKGGEVWCDGVRETHWATCHNWVTPSKTKEFLKSSCFFRFWWQYNLTCKARYYNILIYNERLFRR